MMQANYEVVKETDDRVVIRDLGPWDEFMTVTNAAETVVEEIIPWLKGRRLFYYDSEGKYGEIVIVDGVFAGFAYAKDGQHEI